MAYVPNSVELSKALDHVFHEIWQLTLAAGATTSQVMLKNAILESRLLHVRNLLDFFERPTSGKDDVLSAHYDFPASRVDVDQQSGERLNKDLAHLTYSRTRRREADKAWHHDQAVLPVLSRCLEFAEHVLRTRAAYGERTKEEWHTLLASLAEITGSAAA